MRRREVLLLAASALSARPASARLVGRTYRLAVLSPSARSIEIIREIVLPELARLGFSEGSNLALDFRAGPDAELSRLALEAVDGKPDAILAIAGAAARAARERTSTVPIMMLGGEDAILEGFAGTLARPGSNLTAVVILTSQLEPKRLALLHEAVPAARRVAALLYGDSDPVRQRQGEELGRAARTLGLELSMFRVREPDEFRPAFSAMREWGAQALLIAAHARLFESRAELIGLARLAGLPTVCEWAAMARDGCLLGYGPDRAMLYRNAAAKLARLLRGVAAADLPIEQPTMFTFAINLGTAAALDLAIPPALLARADEVIE